MEEPSEVQREAIRLWARRCKEDLHFHENFRQYILEAREISEKRKAKLARPRAMKNRRTAKRREKITKTLNCPRCGKPLVCPSRGWPRKCDDLPTRLERSRLEINRLSMSKI